MAVAQANQGDPNLTRRLRRIKPQGRERRINPKPHIVVVPLPITVDANAVEWS